MFAGEGCPISGSFGRVFYVILRVINSLGTLIQIPIKTGQLLSDIMRNALPENTRGTGRHSPVDLYQVSTCCDALPLFFQWDSMVQEVDLTELRAEVLASGRWDIGFQVL